MSLPTPYYVDDFATLYHGDCREILPLLADASVDLVLTDPPYGIGFDTNYNRFSGGWSGRHNAYVPVAGDDSAFDPAPWLSFPTVVLWGANCYSQRLPIGSWFVWDKRHWNGAAFLADAEVAWVKGGHGVYIYAETQQGCVRRDPVVHPTQKPVGLMRWCIGRFKNAALVLDPFAGSGTTLVAAKQLGRRAIGIELEEKYCALAARRLSQDVLALGGPLGGQP